MEIHTLSYLIYVGLSIAIELNNDISNPINCVPDGSKTKDKDGFCVDTDQLDNLCSTKEISASKNDCRAFDGNWCCYDVPPRKDLKHLKAVPQSNKINMYYKYTVEPITIPSLTVPKIPLVGKLFRPANALNGTKLPISIIIGPVGTCKELTTEQYATRIAKLGNFAITIDHRYYGATGGTPAQFEYPPAKVEDLLSVIDYATKRPEFDAERLCLVGVCQAVNWVTKAALVEPRIKRIAIVSGHYLYPSFNQIFFQVLWNGNITVEERIKGGEVAIEHYNKQGVVDYIPIVGLSDAPNRLLPLESTYRYYIRWSVHGVKGLEWIGNWQNNITKMSEKYLWENEVDKDLARLETPIFVVVGNNSATPPRFVQPLFDTIPACNKHYVSIGDHYSHVQFYDDPEIIDRAVAEIANWVTFTDTSESY